MVGLPERKASRNSWRVKINGSIFYVEEIRTKQKLLAAVSMKKYKAATPSVTKNGPPAHTSETFRSLESEKVTRETEKVKDESGGTATQLSRENVKPWPERFSNAIQHTSAKKLQEHPDFGKGHSCLVKRLFILQPIHDNP